MTRGLVTIIVACFNGAKYIDACFNSILKQTYRNIEVVFGDDGSTDDSCNIAETYSRLFDIKGMKLICFKQANIGMVTNRALELASGEFICVLDVDDIIYSDSVEQRVEFMKAHPDYVGVRTNGYKCDEKGRKELFVAGNTESIQPHIFEDLLLGRTFNWAGSYMVRRDALDRAYSGQKIYESRYGANLQMLLAVAYVGKMGFINLPLMEYRYNSGSITHGNRKYEKERERYIGFKTIRLAILRQLGLDDLYTKRLNAMYLNILLDLDLVHNKEEEFIYDYESLLSLYEKPQMIHQYHYYRLKGELMRMLIARINLIKQRLWNG